MEEIERHFFWTYHEVIRDLARASCCNHITRKFEDIDEDLELPWGLIPESEKEKILSSIRRAAIAKATQDFPSIIRLMEDQYGEYILDGADE